MPVSREDLEAQLNDFDPARRREALAALLDLVKKGDIALPEPRRAVNLHCHTFFSFNGYGYSPTCFAWKARCEGLMVAGIMDFDVLDGVDEFLEAAGLLGLKGCAGIETRVYVPGFETREINSPGEPGVAYYVGAGFTTSTAPDTGVLDELKEVAQKRNRRVMARVNSYLSPVQLDYDRDVLPLAPRGNPTERHLCVAYDHESRAIFPDPGGRADFWAEKLGGDPATVQAMFGDPPVFQGHIRSKTMKAGGVGYVQPEGPDFPLFSRVNDFILAAGAIPAYAWLDGLSQGEQDIEELLDLTMNAGAAALNIIPDRNWNIEDPATKKVKVAHLHAIVEKAQARDLPIVVGTEMNAYGQRFVDAFDSPELQPVTPAFLEGGYIVYAHTLLQKAAGMGYLSDWARSRFRSTRAKNAFFATLGETIHPQDTAPLAELHSEMAPEQVLRALAK